MTAGHLERVGYLIHRYIQYLRQLLGGGFALIILLKALEGLVDLVERSYLVEGQTHNTALLSQSLQDRLTNPPYGVRDKLKSAGLVELLGGLDQSQVAFVDQVRKA